MWNMGRVLRKSISRKAQPTYVKISRQKKRRRTALIIPVCMI